jgi:phosphoglycolate phosphatase
MHIAFDFDGTVCNSIPVFMEIAQRYCSENHINLIPLADARKIGLKGLIKHYHATPLQIAKILLWGRSQLAQSYPRIPLIPGIIPVLKKLSTIHSLSLITSTNLTLVKSNLTNHQILPLFSEIIAGVDLFGKSHKLKKHLPDYYIGDETRDIEAARKSGCKSIAVTWGFEDKELLTTSQPDFIAHSPEDLLKLLL